MGTCSIRADQPGDATYAPASPVVRSFEVTASASNLSGHFSAGGADQAGGAVYVFSADAYVYVGAATADGSGDYSIDLAPGDYKLYLGPVSAGYGLQWYGGSGDWDTATPITVSGATTEDIALPPLASASNLSGHFSAGGADQAGGAVYVFSADAYVYVGAATADGSGDYSIDLAPGDYKLYLGPVSAGYGLQWYGGSGDWDTATPITVSGATTEDIALPPLASASNLSGHFSAGGADQAGGAVYVFSADAYVYVGAATADGSGDYSIDLAPGDYRAVSGTGQRRLRAPWYGGSGDWDTATPITRRGHDRGHRPAATGQRLEPVRPLQRRRSRPGRWCGLRVQRGCLRLRRRRHRRWLRRLQHRSRPRRLQAVSGTGQRRLRAPVVWRQR